MKHELEGYKEATAGPSSHPCNCKPLPAPVRTCKPVDVTISRRRVILVCYQCNTYWYTGKFEGDLTASRIALIRAADELYGLPEADRRKRVHQAAVKGRQLEERAIIHLFRRGMKLEEIAKNVDLPQPTVYRVLWTSGYRLRDQRCGAAQSEAA